MSYTKMFLDLINEGYSGEEATKIVQQHRRAHEKGHEEHHVKPSSDED